MTRDIIVLTVLLWLAAFLMVRSRWMRATRIIVRRQITQDIQHIKGSEAEIATWMKNEPDNPAVAIKYAALAQDRHDWTAVAARGRAIDRQFPHLLFGRLLMARAAYRMGDTATSDAILQRLNRQFPEDTEVAEFLIEHARAHQRWRQIARVARQMRLLNSNHANAFAYEIEAYLALGDEKSAKTVLAKAEFEFKLQEQVLHSLQHQYEEWLYGPEPTETEALG